MSDYKYSIEAKNVNKVFYKKTQRVNALIDFSIKIEKPIFYYYLVLLLNDRFYLSKSDIHFDLSGHRLS